MRVWNRIAQCAVAVCALYMLDARAYTSQWEWTVDRYTSISGSTETVVANGPTTSYATKAEALEALKTLQTSFIPASQFLTNEAGISSMTTSILEYKYTVPDVAPTVDAWRYFTGQYASEAEALEGKVAEWRGPCGCEPQLTLAQDWHDAPAGDWGNWQIQYKEYTAVNPNNGDVIAAIGLYRDRFYHCPSTYTVHHPPKQLIP